VGGPRSVITEFRDIPIFKLEAFFESSVVLPANRKAGSRIDKVKNIKIPVFALWFFRNLYLPVFIIVKVEQI